MIDKELVEKRLNFINHLIHQEEQIIKTINEYAYNDWILPHWITRKRDHIRYWQKLKNDLIETGELSEVKE